MLQLFAKTVFVAFFYPLIIATRKPKPHGFSQKDSFFDAELTRSLFWWMCWMVVIFSLSSYLSNTNLAAGITVGFALCLLLVADVFFFLVAVLLLSSFVHLGFLFVFPFLISYFLVFSFITYNVKDLRSLIR